MAETAPPLVDLLNALNSQQRASIDGSQVAGIEPIDGVFCVYPLNHQHQQEQYQQQQQQQQQ
ncbi:hypothetical protein ACSSS7_006249 [Eimeria intestinalis]